MEYGGSGKNMGLGIFSKRKKGIFFTVMALLLLSLFIISYTFYDQIQDRKSIQNRISTMNDFIFSLEKDVSRQVYITGYRTIFLLDKQIIESGSYISNVDSVMDEAFFNGTFYGQPQELLLGVSYSDIVDSMYQQASKNNLNLTIHSPNIFIGQDDPWHVKVTLTYNFSMNDNQNLASWNKISSISGYIPIEDFDDPIYIISTNGKLSNKIIKSNYSFSSSNLGNLSLHNSGMFYISSSEAPNFLDRLSGNLTARNPQGIESLIYAPTFSLQGIALQDKSMVDHIYFSSENPTAYSVSGMPPWFKLDSSHLSIYNITI